MSPAWSSACATCPRTKPIRFIGVGEQIDDLRPFTAKDFVDALFE